jgi:rubrerythrin
MTGQEPQRTRPPADEGGDPACWLGRVCPECGAFTEQAAPTTCPRCGTALQAD